MKPGLSPTTLILFKHLHAAGSATVGELVKASGFERHVVDSALERARETGLASVDRAAKPFRYTLTDEGRAAS